MKQGISFIFIFLIISIARACPCFNCPDEKRPDTALVLYKTVTIYKNPKTGLAWLRYVPRKYFNSVSFRFPKDMLSQSTFELDIEHKYFDTNDEWGIAHYRHDLRKINIDAHVAQGAFDQTQLYYSGSDCFGFYVKQTSGEMPDSFQLEVVLLYVPPISAKDEKNIKSRANCDSPNWIPQSIWRKGLADPIPGRSSTQTHHCIVHHSSDGNGDTNYTNLVRSYYVFHTQVNGWDDIGYNFLIAANGAIYAGRDPEKPEIRQDNVLGAHFCGKNTNTMGVCMIGNFTDSVPTELAMESLFHLIGWKIKKDSLDPYGKFIHPDGNGNLLPVVAGHRDGCNTECPGNQLYNKLQQVRDEAAKCAVINAQSNILSDANFRLIQSSEGTAIANIPVGTTLELYDVTGQLLWHTKILNPVEKVNVADMKMGMYVLKISYNGSCFTRKVPLGFN